MDCLFCKIAAKQIKAAIVFENDRIIAFKDIDPKAPVHVLIIPKEHLSGLNDIRAEHNALLGEIQNAAREIAKQLNINETGYRLISNCGKDAGQAVDHLHYHLLGGRKLQWPPG